MRLFDSLQQQFPMALPLGATVLATLFWGSSFITVSAALEYTNPLTLVMLRFGVGAFFVALMLRGHIHRIPKATWRAGAICGIAIFTCYSLNTIGLMTISSSASGFLTALYVPFTPLLVWVFFGRRPAVTAFIGVAMAFCGLILLANPFELTLANNWGEWATILSAFLSAFEIILVGRYAPRCEARQLAFTQLTCVFVFALIAQGIAYLTGIPLKETTFNHTVIFSILWLATIVAFVQVLLSWAQRFVAPQRAAIIFAMESVFAAIIGYIAGENLGFNGLVGGALIVAGILVSELKFLNSRSGLARK